MLKNKLIAAVIGSLSVVSLAYAQGTTVQNNTPIYIGAEAGVFSLGLDDGESNLIEENYVYANPYVGYQFHPNVGVEAGYFVTTNESKHSDSGAWGLDAGTSVETELQFQGANLDLVGTLPVHDRIDLIGSVGAIYLNSDLSVSATQGTSSASLSTSADDTYFRGGLGAKFKLTDNLKARATAHYIADSDVDNAWTYGAGLEYNF